MHVHEVHREALRAVGTGGPESGRRGHVGGRLVEQGSHATLMQSGGMYAELYDLQARAYR